jgi:hypothetical protein
MEGNQPACTEVAFGYCGFRFVWIFVQKWREKLRRSEERSQGDGDVGFCLAREETDARGIVDENWKGKEEGKK